MELQRRGCRCAISRNEGGKISGLTVTVEGMA